MHRLPTLKNNRGISMVAMLLGIGVIGLAVMSGTAFKLQSLSSRFFSTTTDLEDDAVNSMVHTLVGYCDNYLDGQSVSGNLAQVKLDQLIAHTGGVQDQVNILRVKLDAFRPKTIRPFAPDPPNPLVDTNYAHFVYGKAEIFYKSKSKGADSITAPERSKKAFFVGRVREISPATIPATFEFTACGEHGSPYSYGLYWGAKCAVGQTNTPAVASPLTSACTEAELVQTMLKSLCNHRNAFAIPALMTGSVEAFCDSACAGLNVGLNHCDPTNQSNLYLPGGKYGLAAALAAIAPIPSPSPSSSGGP